MPSPLSGASILLSQAEQSQAEGQQSPGWVTGVQPWLSFSCSKHH